MSMKIMDYSLLIGIHDLVKGNRDNIRDATLSAFEPNAETIKSHQIRRSISTPHKRILVSSNSSIHTPDVDIVFDPSTAKLPEVRLCINFCRDRVIDDTYTVLGSAT
jgi:hypothetical protein